ncbi:hypothetical protein BDD43_4698 [Mucilaginibacter gracilis]|uniref:Uncharacterized protein n=1 Tax=Mucilaginibacter gracilis TaxID=423350 RepID=A0A495J640_9SPHI|nr:hypothetical protein [Mucilaginibacter gracilis]RKR84460.1 hypothetical protein BDD43_4698 [Mucilaginibacter gracilis]
MLPLGDFTLMSDLPRMYHNYEKLTKPEEAGLIDFIGDYLFAGKILLGHNKQDKPETPSTSVQFQHSPSAFNFLYSRLEVPFISIKVLKVSHTLLRIPISITDFHPELFRPPLA